MKMYLAKPDGAIDTVEALPINDRFIYVHNKRRSRISKRGAYFNTFSEAKQYLLWLKEREVVVARAAFYARQDELRRIQSLKE